MATAAELKQILKEDKYGKNLYDHLTETLMKILVDRPANAFESFELISAAVCMRLRIFNSLEIPNF